MNPVIELAMTFIKRRDSRVPSFTALVSVLGISFGVAAFLVVVTVFNSFENELKSLLLAANPNVFVVNLPDGIKDARNYMENLKKQVPASVEGMSLFEYNEVILSKENHTAAVVLKGIEGAHSASAKDMARAIRPKGALEELNNDRAILGTPLEGQAGKHPAILLGKGLALKLNAKEGEIVTLTSGHFGMGGANRIRQFQVKGFMSLGLAQYDDRLALINLNDAVSIFGKPGWAKGIEIKLKDPKEAMVVAAALRSKIPYTIRSWQELDKGLFEQIERDGQAIKLIVLIITFVAGFNIAVTLRLSVVDRIRQIALLRSLGASRRFIVQVFLVMSGILGICGATLGVLMGLVILKVFSGFELGDLQTFYFLERLPVEYDWKLILSAFFVSLVLSFISALYPAYMATRVSPLYGLKPGY